MAKGEGVRVLTKGAVKTPAMKHVGSNARLSASSQAAELAAAPQLSPRRKRSERDDDLRLDENQAEVVQHTADATDELLLAQAGGAAADVASAEAGASSGAGVASTAGTASAGTLGGLSMGAGLVLGAVGIAAVAAAGGGGGGGRADDAGD